MFLRLAIVFICFLTLTSCTKKSEKLYIGIVVDSNEVPIPGAFVQLNCNKSSGLFQTRHHQTCGNATTGPDGSFEFTTKLAKKDEIISLTVIVNGNSIQVQNIPREDRNQLWIVVP
jgi:hypothetical protein